MSQVNIKYLKDENGNKISPVVSTSSVYEPVGHTAIGKSAYFKSSESVATVLQAGNNTLIWRDVNNTYKNITVTQNGGTFLTIQVPRYIFYKFNYECWYK